MIRHRLILAIICIVTACMASGPAGAATYYVSTTGSDSGSGSQDAPWATLQQAADTVQPGDTVIVEAGQYAGFRATTTGASGSVITFTAEDDALVTINSLGTDNERDLVELAGSGISHWTIEGFNILASDWFGLSVYGESDGKADTITLRDITVLGSNRSGMYLEFTDNGLVEDCVVGENGYNGIHFKADGDDAVIRDNILYNNHGGIQVNGAEDFGGDGMMSGAAISTNLLFGNNYDDTGGAIGLDGVTASTIDVFYPH